MEIYANIEKADFLRKRLVRFEDSDLVIVQLDIHPRDPAGQIEVAVTRLNAGLPVLLLSLEPVTDYRTVARYGELVGRLRIRDDSSQYVGIEQAIEEFLGQP